MNNYCLTANTNGETSVARLGRPFIAGRPPSAARTLEKILAAPSAGAADGGQTLLEAVEAAIVGRCIIEGAPGRRPGPWPRPADEEQQCGAADQLVHGFSS